MMDNTLSVLMLSTTQLTSKRSAHKSCAHQKELSMDHSLMQHTWALSGSEPIWRESTLVEVVTMHLRTPSNTLGRLSTAGDRALREFRAIQSNCSEVLPTISEKLQPSLHPLKLERTGLSNLALPTNLTRTGQLESTSASTLPRWLATKHLTTLVSQWHTNFEHKTSDRLSTPNSSCSTELSRAILGVCLINFAIFNTSTQKTAYFLFLLSSLNWFK